MQRGLSPPVPCLPCVLTSASTAVFSLLIHLHKYLCYKYIDNNSDSKHEMRLWPHIFLTCSKFVCNGAIFTILNPTGDKTSETGCKGTGEINRLEGFGVHQGEAGMCVCMCVYVCVYLYVCM